MSGNNPNPGLGEEQMKGGGGVGRREGEMGRCGAEQSGGDEAAGGDPGQELSCEYV